MEYRRYIIDSVVKADENSEGVLTLQSIGEIQNFLVGNIIQIQVYFYRNNFVFILSQG